MLSKKKILTANEGLKFAVKKLAMSDYSSYEIFSSLCKKGSSKNDAQAVVDKLLELSYINDEKFCGKICERWQEEGTNGKYVLRMKLLKKGIDANVIDEVFSQMNFDETVNAKRALIKYLKSNKIIDEKSMSKLMRHLANRGFRYNIIQSVIQSECKSTVLQENPCLDTYFKSLYN